MKFKFFAIPLLLGVALTVSACETPTDNVEEVPGTDPIEEPGVAPEQPGVGTEEEAPVAPEAPPAE